MKRKHPRSKSVNVPWTWRQAVLDTVRRSAWGITGVALFSLLFLWYLAAPAEWLKYLLLAAMGITWLAADVDTLRTGVSGHDNIFGKARRDTEPRKFWIRVTFQAMIGIAIFAAGMALLARHWWST